MSGKVFWFCVLLVVLGAGVVGSVWYHLDIYLQRDAAVVESRGESRDFGEAVIAFLLVETRARQAVMERDVGAVGQVSADLVAARRRIAVMGEIVLEPPLDGAVRQLTVETRQRLDVIQEVIDLVRGGKAEKALLLFQSGDSSDLIQSICRHATVVAMAIDERLKTRVAACQDAMIGMSRWVISGLMALAVATAWLVALMVLHARRAARMTLEVETARDGLEQANREKDQFLGVLSHELRTPLTPALITIEMLERSRPRQSAERQDLALVREQLELETRLIDDLLDVSRVLQGKVRLKGRPVHMHELVNKVIRRIRPELEQRGQVVDVDLEAEEDLIIGDPEKLQKVFWHLLSNASKFSSDRSRISLRTKTRDESVVLSVRDSGIGFTPEQKSLIFAPFKQVDATLKRRFGGLGLGMALAKPLVEVHGGRIDAMSPGMNQGATFTVVLPLAHQRETGKGIRGV